MITEVLFCWWTSLHSVERACKVQVRMIWSVEQRNTRETVLSSLVTCGLGGYDAATVTILNVNIILITFFLICTMFVFFQFSPTFLTTMFFFLPNFFFCPNFFFSTQTFFFCPNFFFSPTFFFFETCFFLSNFFLHLIVS